MSSLQTNKKRLSSSKEICKRESEVLAKTQKLPYCPIAFESGKGALLYDYEGNEYIDLLSSASSANIGHGNCEIAQAVKDQMSKLAQFSTVYFSCREPVEYAEKLKRIMPVSVNIEFLHGRMKPAEKNEIMDRFANNQIQILVSTTVVEVGVNVPNATVMMVENAERFGLAQLHQLRGRVGRGKYQSYCIFINGSGKKEALERLNILCKSNDGFLIANEDLKLRGPGDFFGVRQSGDFEFRLGDIMNDANILKQASEAVELILNEEVEISDKQRKIIIEYENDSINI